MNNCYFCEYGLADNIELTLIKTKCCNKYYCEYHLNDLFECNNCNNVYCIFCDSSEYNKQINIFKCMKCYLTFCNNCFIQLPTIEKSYLDGICKNCYKE